MKLSKLYVFTLLTSDTVARGAKLGNTISLELTNTFIRPPKAKAPLRVADGVLPPLPRLSINI